MSQPVRFATLEKFKAGEIRLLCCSDVAARGLDIGGLSHVFNFDVPHHAEDYVHRIGRTGRAGKEGRAFTLATPEDRLAVEAVEKLTGHAIPRIAIPALDPVDWSEDDGRRRGRGRTSAAPKRESKPRAEPKPCAEPKPRPIVEPQPDLPPPDVAEAAPRRERRPRREEPRREEPRREGPRAPEPVREEPRRDRGERRYRRDDDLGPRVVGFGDDTPAFMMKFPPRAGATRRRRNWKKSPKRRPEHERHRTGRQPEG